MGPKRLYSITEFCYAHDLYTSVVHAAIAAGLLKVHRADGRSYLIADEIPDALVVRLKSETQARLLLA